MYKFRLIFLVILLIGFVAPADATISNIAVRYGKTFNDPEIDQYDFYGSFDLPWSKALKSGWNMRTDIEIIMAALDGEEETTFKPSVLPKLILTSPGGRFDLLVGFGPGVMLGETTYGEHDLGGEIFFQGNLGLRIGVTESFFIGFRYYHQSNFNIYDSNDSLNMHQLELVWEF